MAGGIEEITTEEVVQRQHYKLKPELNLLQTRTTLREKRTRLITINLEESSLDHA